MDRSVKDDDGEPFFHLSSSASSPALAYSSTRRDLNNKKQQQGFDFSADDVISGYEFQASTQKQRRANTVEQVSSRRHRSSGSSVYLTGELSSSRKDAEMDSYDLKIVSSVERTIKKYADNILQVLEGINGRLSQLESVTQGLKHSVTSLNSLVDDYHGEADARSRALNNNIMEMHRAVQILRDRQDIVEAHAELAKFQASKAEATGEKASAYVPLAEQPVVSSQTVTQEQRYLPVAPNLVQERSSTQLQVPLQQSNEISGRLQQLSLSPDVNTLPQELVSAQGLRQQQHSQQSHVWPQTELQLSTQRPELTQSMPGVFTQQISQPQQGSQALPLQGPVQQSPPAPSQLPRQTPVVMSQSQQAQFQVGPQRLNIHQPVLQQSAVGQPSVQVPHTQFGSAQILPVQSMPQLQQVQPASSSQFQTPQQISPSQSTGGQVMVQPPHMHHIPSAHLPLQGLSAGQSPFQFTQQNESLAYAPRPQGAGGQAPSSEVEYGVGPPYNLSNAGSSQQHYSSSQLILSAQPGNPYQRSPLPFPGPQPVYASQTGRPMTPSGSNARTLPVAQNVYNQSVSGGPLSSIPRNDGIVEKVGAMGFSMDEARSVIRRLTDHGQYVDLNAVLDLLMNGRNQSRRGWQAT